jgi:hypothetical protein
VQSAPGVQCVGLTANLPLKGLPTELNALTKRASGNARCERSMRDSSRLVKNFSTPLTGRSSAMSRRWWA